MNNSSVKDTITKLVDRLDKEGLLEKLELSDEDIADIIWLACHMGVVEAKPKQSEPKQPESEGSIPFWRQIDLLIGAVKSRLYRLIRYV